MLKLYLDPCTINCRKVLAGLDYLGTEFTLDHIDFFKGQQKSEEFKKINPCATVPAAKDGDLILTESNAILQYAADLKGDTPAYPSKDLKKRADINRWLLWEASVWFSSCYIYLVEYVVKPLMSAQADQTKIDEEAPNFHKLASILEGRLAESGKFLCGSEPTLADFAVAAPMHLHEASRLPLDQYPSLRRWIANVEQLPSWRKTQGPVEKALLPEKRQSNGSSGANGSAHQVRADFNYTRDLGDKLTELYFYEDPRSELIHEPGDDAHAVTVTDGWHRADSFSVDKEGFAVLNFTSHYPSDRWHDEDHVHDSFYPEVVELLKQEFGAKRVLVFDHTIRTKVNVAKKLTQETNTSQRAPVRLVHCDYTAESGPIRVKQLLPEEANDLLARRVAFFNVWKPLNKVEEQPLAMCDVTSSPPDNYFKLHLRYRDRSGENYVMRYSPEHKWWYFPHMEPDKCIVLKTYESDTDRARFVGHTAFDDPESRPDAPARQSIEIRTICFF
ncbi:hypothetical protein K431DRAFT_343848 [Polychaeton citri CBS 116435]|uniref:Glutathione S-transferase n=1 Tax=Polychaeton citri CBS 116435 TaxID=1314669 RepID=A0A9P4QGU1_9PEZI|nr:hypothetical protein K431DRAFT_343848 [Polychaeton citri CBS 116435]